ncbi:MAG: UDP-N-acetylmuramoyl-tripeptide--D-alanyl-D-alanine ligase [Myxococcales bacterium]|nr:UDP-N-acetylmuramoyl-tripeptide--D-alanyl-D-alanine ligase [Myxococcales bacterium]
MRLAAAFLQQSLAQHLQAPVPAGLICSGVETDSRKKCGDALFVALAGDRFDGHDFVVDVLSKGAVAAMVHVMRPEYQPYAERLIVVDDTLKALQQLARSHLDRLPGKRIGVTGSNGKTTTKELIKGALAGAVGSGYIHANAGNFNNHIGLPLSALQAQTHHQFIILEMGMNHFDEITELAGIGQPQIGVITNIGSAHAGNLGGVSGVAKAKGELYEYLAQNNGVLVVNADDPRCLQQAKRWPEAEVIQFGRSEMAQVRITKNEVTAQGLSIGFQYEEESIEVHLPLVGLHNAWNAAAAMAVAVASGISLTDAAKGLEGVLPSSGRLQQKELQQGITVLDDTYNANPESMEMGLQTLLAMEGQRHIVVLGEMLELGDMAEASHRSIGAAVAQKEVAALFVCGALGRFYLEGAEGETSFSPELVWAENSDALGLKLKQFVQAGDVLLVKGSRGSQMEKVFAALEQE